HLGPLQDAALTPANVLLPVRSSETNQPEDTPAMDKHDIDHDPFTTPEPRKTDPVVLALAAIGALMLLPLVSTVLAVILKVGLGLLAGAIGLAAGLVSLALGLALGMAGLIIGLIGAVAGFLVTPPGLILIAAVI